MIKEQIDRLIMIEHNPKKVVDLCKDVDLPPIAVPSYRNRNGTIISKLGEIPTRVFLFVYEDDRQNYPEEFPENVTVVVITHKDFEDLGMEWRGLPQKRHFIVEYCKKNGIKEVIQMDDDINFEAKLARPSGEKEVFVSLFDALRVVVADARENNAAIASMTGNDLKIGHFEWDKPRSFRGRPANCVYENIEILANAGIQYVKWKGIEEDMDLDLNCYVHGLPVIEYEWMKHSFALAIGGKDSIASENNLLANFNMVFYEKWHDYITLYVREDKKTGKRKLFKKYNFDKIDERYQTVDETLLQLCKQRDAEKVMDYLEEKVEQELLCSIDDL